MANKAQKDNTDAPKQATGEATLGTPSEPILTYWWSPPVTFQQALAAQIAEQPILAQHVSGNLVSMNPNYTPTS